MAKKIEEKYQELSEIQHILNRPGMWVGSTKSEEKESFIYNTKTGKFEMRITNYIPAMLKVVDEVISNSCDEFRRKDNMGLTTWKNAPDGRILKSDVSIAKNYLDEKQIRQLERAVTGYFDYIEDLIEGYSTLRVSGRDALTKLLVSNEYRTDGAIFDYGKFPIRDIVVNYIVDASSPEVLREKNN